MKKKKNNDEVTPDGVLNNEYSEEAERIISRLKSGDKLFAKKFFYGTNNKGCNISRLRSKIISRIKQTYHYNLGVEEFGDIVYAYLWDNGTWSVLDKYSKKSSFFCWLDTVSCHEVMKYLEYMKYINVSRERTSGNTRLLGTSVSPGVWDYIISDIMPNGKNKDMLKALLVDGKNEKDMAKDFNMDCAEIRESLKKAENDLKDKLVRSGNYYEGIVLKDKSPRNIEVSEDFVKDFVKWQEEKVNVSPLADVLGVSLSKEELHDKVVEFLYDFSGKMEWSDMDRLVWRLRFIENVPPVEVAERLGKARPWVDTRYSQLNVKFKKVVREWWKKNSR